MEGRRIPVVAEPVSDCAQCEPSACCLANTALHLTDREADFMRSSGNYLIPAVPPVDYFRAEAPAPIGYGFGQDKRLKIYVDENNPTDSLEAGYGIYIMVTHCKNLATDALGRTSCSAYEQRPRACKIFTPGSQSCHGMQRLRDRVTY